MTLDSYAIELKSIVQLYEALDLRLGANESSANVVAEEDGINISNPSNTNKWKSYINKSKVQFQVSIHFNGPNKVVCKGIKTELKNNWSFQGVESPPKTIIETIKKSDTFIYPKTGVNASESQGLNVMQQGEEYSDKGGKGRGGPALAMVKEDAVSLQPNNMGVETLIAAIQTPVL